MYSNRYSFHYSLLAVLLIVLLSSCRKAEDKWTKNRPRVYKTEGVVVLDGKPLAGATVVFKPKTGEFTAVGVSDESGKFRMTTFKDFDGVIEDEFQVSVEKIEWVPTRPRSTQPASDGGVDLPPLKQVVHTPVKYADFDKSGLKAVVTATGPNAFEFELISKP